MTASVNLTVFYCIGAISISMSLLVLGHLSTIGLRSALARLVFYLQFTILFEEITSLPGIYSSPPSLCEWIAAIKQYFTLGNLVVNCFFSCYTYVMIYSTSSTKDSLRIYIQAIILLFPIITFIPLANGGYGKQLSSNTSFCTFTNSLSGQSWNVIFISIAGMINICSITANVLVVLRLLQDGSQNLKALLNVVLGSTTYCFITVGCWIPKLFTSDIGRFHSNSVSIFASRLFTFFAGISYFLIYILELEKLKKFEYFVQEDYKARNGKTDDWDFSDNESRASVGSISRVSDMGINRINSNASDYIRHMFVSNSSASLTRKKSTSTDNPLSSYMEDQVPNSDFSMQGFK